MDADGYVFLVDRKKDMLKTSGFQVWPRRDRGSNRRASAVLEVGVAGVPDAVKGEVAQAWVVLKADRHATEDELRAYCRERLAPYKVPRECRVSKRAAQDDGREGAAAHVGSPMASSAKSAALTCDFRRRLSPLRECGFGWQAQPRQACHRGRRSFPPRGERAFRRRLTTRSRAIITARATTASPSAMTARLVTAGTRVPSAR